MTSQVDDQEVQTLIRLARKYMWAGDDVRQTLEQAKIFLARNDFYSEYPTLKDVEGSFEYAPLNGEDGPHPIFDDARIFKTKPMAKLARTLSEYITDFDPPTEEAEGFFWRNTQFSSLDACAYYGLIRHLKPKRIIEIGSGNSTFVAHQAAQHLDTPPIITCVDPAPRADISKIEGITFLRDTIQNVDLEDVLGGLKPNDIVFYDGSHTLKTGSDTVFFYLKILPYLPKGIVVHSHDVLLPWARRAAAIVNAKLSWSEQYIVMAHLHNRQRYRVMIANHFLAQNCPREAERMLGGKFAIYGGSIWFRILT